jgi:hypothetical protein
MSPRSAPVFGSILSSIIKVATCPIDMAESALDVACGGDGSEESKRNSGVPLISGLRDAVCKPLEELDD